MQEVIPVEDWAQMRENVRRAIHALEVCWRCQRVSECQKYVLGNMVLAWLCPRCLMDMHQLHATPAKKRTRSLSRTFDPDPA